MNRPPFHDPDPTQDRPQTAGERAGLRLSPIADQVLKEAVAAQRLRSRRFYAWMLLLAFVAGVALGAVL